MHTLSKLLVSSVYLSDLFVEKLVTLLADVDDLGSWSAKSRDSLEHLSRNSSCALVLGESIWVVQGVINLLGNLLLVCHV